MFLGACFVSVGQPAAAFCATPEVEMFRLAFVDWIEQIIIVSGNR